MKKIVSYVAIISICVSGLEYNWHPNILLSSRAKIDSLGADALHGHPIRRPHSI
jgi:hypothetical protein